MNPSQFIDPFYFGGNLGHGPFRVNMKNEVLFIPMRIFFDARVHAFWGAIHQRLNVLDHQGNLTLRKFTTCDGFYSFC